MPATKASNWGGQTFFTAEGVNQRMARVIRANSSSIGWVPCTNAGISCSVPITPPLGVACPRKGPSCRSTRMIPMPDMKPEITV